MAVLFNENTDLDFLRKVKGRKEVVEEGRGEVEKGGRGEVGEG
jgi:hypothetical protein